MKYELVQCLSRDVIEGEDRWVYAWKEWVNVSRFGKSVSKYQHRVPSFLTLHAHLRIEETIEDLWNKTIFPQFAFRPLMLVYDLLHGIVCAYGMREILRWWKCRTPSGELEYV